MPVNGKWFDYIGSGQKQRRKVADKIIKLAKDHGAEYADLSSYDYESYITKDSNHPWGKGWVLINKEIYEFYESKLAIEEGRA